MSITLEDFLASPQLGGACEAFQNLAPWRAWLAFGRAVYGLPLERADLELYQRCTGRAAPREGGTHEAVAVVGRQAGKTRFASALVAYEAAMRPPVRDGHLYALLLAQDHRAAVRTAFAYLCAIFDASEALRGLVVARTTDTLELENGVRVAAYPCRPAAIRGLRACVAVADELAYFRSSEMLPQDAEMLRALRPTLATTGGRLVILSSPYGQSGALWELHRRHFGRNDAPVLVWQASAPVMHSDLPADYLARMEQDDPEAYRSEVLGEFRAGLSTLLDPEAIAACVVAGRRELPPVTGLRYEAFADPSGGRADAFTVGIGHRDGERAVVDVLRAWRAPFNPSGVVAEAAALLRDYRVSRVTGDRFAGEWPREACRAHGITYEVARLPKSDLYLALVAHVNAGRLELVDDADLLRELRGLERRRGPSGRDRVDHRPGSHDDRANAVAGLADLLVGRRRGIHASELYGTDTALPGEREVVVKL